MPLQAHATVAKAGVDSLSNVAAVELGPRGVTSNVIAPGPIAGTEGIERLSKSTDRELIQRKIPLGRFGAVRDIADATVYLFSDAANFVNGQTLVGECTKIIQGSATNGLILSGRSSLADSIVQSGCRFSVPGISIIRRSGLGS